MCVDEKEGGKNDLQIKSGRVPKAPGRRGQVEGQLAWFAPTIVINDSMVVKVHVASLLAGMAYL